MDFRSAQKLISRELRDFGFGPTLYDLTFRAASRVARINIWKAIVADAPKPEFLRTPEGYEARLLDADQMRAYIGRENDIEEVIVERARDNGDCCMVVLDHGRLASYGWYSNQVTDLTDELQLRFVNGYVYMYKALTIDRYRGQRLHAIGMSLALQEYLNRGYKGVVSLVDSNNFSSKRSCYRMGYRDIGTIYGIKLNGRYHLRHTKGCQDYQFVIEPKPVRSEAISAVRVA